MKTYTVINSTRFVATEYKGTNAMEAYTIMKKHQINGELVRLFVNGKEVWA